MYKINYCDFRNDTSIDNYEYILSREVRSNDISLPFFKLPKEIRGIINRKQRDYVYCFAPISDRCDNRLGEENIKAIYRLREYKNVYYIIFKCNLCNKYSVLNFYYCEECAEIHWKRCLEYWS